MIEAVSASIGQSTPLFRGVIERLRLADYAKALHLHNPIHYDRAAAIAAGYRDVVAPPGFIISHSLQPRSLKLGSFGIEERRALMGDMRFEHFAPICAGDELSGRTVLVDLQDKQGKRPMEAFSLETRFENQLGETVLVVNETIMQVKQ